MPDRKGDGCQSLLLWLPLNLHFLRLLIEVVVACPLDYCFEHGIPLVTSTAEGKSFGVVKQLLQVIWRFLSSFAEIKAAVLVHRSASI